MKSLLRTVVTLAATVALFGLGFLMLTTQMGSAPRPGEAYTLSLRTGCFENRIERVTLVVRELECLNQAEREALLGATAPADGATSPAARETLAESARRKVKLAEEHYQEKVAAFEAYKQLRQASFEDPFGELMARLAKLLG